MKRTKRVSLGVIGIALWSVGSDAHAAGTVHGWLPPGACDGAVEKSGEREAYFNALKSHTLTVLEQEQKTIQLNQSMLYGTPASPIFNANSEALYEADRMLLGEAARGIESFSTQIAMRQSALDRAKFTQAELYRYIDRQMRDYHQAHRDEVTRHIIAVLGNLRQDGFVVRDAGREAYTGDFDVQTAEVRYRPLDELCEVSAHCIDVSEIQAVIDAGPGESWVYQSRLADLEREASQQLAELETLYGDYASLFPVLSVTLSGFGPWSKTLASILLEQSPSVEAFVPLMRQALDSLEKNIAALRLRVKSMTAESDTRTLAQFTRIRDLVHSEHGLTRFKDIECIVDSEYTAEDILETVLDIGSTALLVGTFVVPPLAGAAALSRVAWLGRIASVLGSPAVQRGVFYAAMASQGVGVLRQLASAREAARWAQSSTWHAGLYPHQLAHMQWHAFYQGLMMLVGTELGFRFVLPFGARSFRAFQNSAQAFRMSKQLGVSLDQAQKLSGRMAQAKSLTQVLEGLHALTQPQLTVLIERIRKTKAATLNQGKPYRLQPSRRVSTWLQTTGGRWGVFARAKHLNVGLVGMLDNAAVDRLIKATKPGDVIDLRFSMTDEGMWFVTDDAMDAVLTETGLAGQFTRADYTDLFAAGEDILGHGWLRLRRAQHALELVDGLAAHQAFPAWYTRSRGYTPRPEAPSVLVTLPSKIRIPPEAQIADLLPITALGTKP